MEIMNDTPAPDSNKSRIEIFANTPVKPNLRHHHHFGVPTYVLNNSLQAGMKINKWWP
jgi:hypothetical protein